MTNQNGILYTNGHKKLVPVKRIDDGEERRWRYWKGSSRYRELPGDEDLINESYRDVVKEAIKDDALQHQRFNKLVNDAGNVLLKIQTVFPFDFFPTIISIDPEKITIQTKNFFNSGEIRSIHIKNVSHIYVDMGPFFAELNIVDQSILDNVVGKVEIPFLKKGEAKRARRIIQGLIVANKEDIDVTKIKDSNIVRKLEEIGRMQ